MKKYLLLLATAFMAISLTSCRDNTVGPDKPPLPPGPDPVDGIVLTTMDEGAYYDQKYSETVGFSSVTLSNASGQKLRLDLFGSISKNAANAKLNTGDYLKGSLEAPAVRKFIPAATATDVVGCIFWDGKGNALPITDGKLNVGTVNNKTKITLELMSGEEEIKGSFENVIKLENKSEYFPHTEDVIVAESAWGNYVGQGMAGSVVADQFHLVLVQEGDKSNKNTHAIQITGFMPRMVDGDGNKVTVAEGTYTITSDDVIGKTPKAFQLLTGSIIDKDLTGTGEYFTNEKSVFLKGWAVSSGTMTVAKSGDTFTITTDFIGRRVDQSGVVNKIDEPIKFSYVGPMDYMRNDADPYSNYTEGKDLGKITTKTAIVQLPKIQGFGGSTWLYYIFGHGINTTMENGSLSMDGEGDVMMLFLQGPSSASDLAVGEFTMGGSFYYTPNPATFTAYPGDPYVDLAAGVLGPEYGCWYSRFVTGRMTVAGAVHSRGSVTATLTGDIYNMEFEIFDKNNNKFFGSFEANRNDITILRSDATRSADAPLKLSPSIRVK